MTLRVVRGTNRRVADFRHMAGVGRCTSVRSLVRCRDCSDWSASCVRTRATGGWAGVGSLWRAVGRSLRERALVEKDQAWSWLGTRAGSGSRIAHRLVRQGARRTTARAGNRIRETAGWIWDRGDTSAQTGTGMARRVAAAGCSPPLTGTGRMSSIPSLALHPWRALGELSCSWPNECSW